MSIIILSKRMPELFGLGHSHKLITVQGLDIVQTDYLLKRKGPEEDATGPSVCGLIKELGEYFDSRRPPNI